MQPLAMAILLGVFWALFAVSCWCRWKLLCRGAASGQMRFDRLGERLRRVWDLAFAQRKLRYYPAAGWAHQMIFVGFLVLLARTLVLWGRGFDPEFDLWVLGPKPLFGVVPLGNIYALLKDGFAVLVLGGVAVFAYLRLVRPQRRMTLGVEGILILGIIAVMMLADLLYDGADLARRGVATWDPYPHIASSLVAALLADQSDSTLTTLEHLGFWTHAALVLLFLNLLPYSKHFHVLTAIPNTFFANLAPAGRLPPMASDSAALLDKMDAASQLDDPNEADIGYGRLAHLGRKDYLDLFTCTECGRCSEHCPASLTGKKLSPKQLTLDLRDHLYRHHGAPLDLVPQVVDPEVLWECTTCRACEEQCPVGISYVDKIVQLRRPLVMVRGEPMPNELARPFDGMESKGNPWGLSPLDRTAWAEGLDVPTMADKPDAELLYWVGCAASYDARSRKVARALVRLLQTAGVDFAILGAEETCTGDAARRAGNEFLFVALAEQNLATFQKYRQSGGIQRIVTACPHCYNTLANEYPDFGGRYEVLHHSELLSALLAEGRLTPRSLGPISVSYHDPCYLGRYNGIYDPPRDVLTAIPGVEVREVTSWSRHRALCCGAGGAQMWLEERGEQRISEKRTLQLVGIGSSVVTTSCPFCMTMVNDGLKSLDQPGPVENPGENPNPVENLDIAELLARACQLTESEVTKRTG